MQYNIIAQNLLIVKYNPKNFSKEIHSKILVFRVQICYTTRN